MRVEQSAIIHRSPDEVFTFLENRANDTAWMTSVMQSEWLDSGGTPRVGRRGRMVIRILRRRMKFLAEVTDYVPGRRIAHRTVEGPLPLTTACTCEPADTAVSPPSSAKSIQFRAGGPAGWGGHLSDVSFSTDLRATLRGSKPCWKRSAMTARPDRSASRVRCVICLPQGTSEISTTQEKQPLSCAAIATRDRFLRPRRSSRHSRRRASRVRH